MNFETTPFNSLTSFIRAEQAGTATDDCTYRAYDLDRMTGANSLHKALKVLGRNSVNELTDDIRCIGLLPPEGVSGATCRWYVWYRLCRGEVSKWPLRA